MISKCSPIFAVITTLAISAISITPCYAEFKLIAAKAKPGSETLCLSAKRISIVDGQDKKATIRTSDGRKLSSVIRETDKFKSLRLTVNGACTFTYRENIG